MMQERPSSNECTLKYIERATRFPGTGTPVLSPTQANFLLSKAAKALTPADARRLGRDESYERFKDIRWGWQGGKPYCPHCGYVRVYEFKCRAKFKCASCGKQFSVTSRTIFHARKLPYQTILRAIALRLHEPANPLRTAAALGVQYKTSCSLASRFKIFLGQAKYAEIRTKPSDTNWPYLIPGTRDPNNMLSVVHSMIPKTLPEHVRADVGQDIIVGLLSGAFTEDALAAQVRDYIKGHYARSEWRFDTVSLDAPIPGMRDLRVADRVPSVHAPNQIEETYRAQIERARERDALNGTHLSLEEAEEFYGGGDDA